MGYTGGVSDEFIIRFRPSGYGEYTLRIGSEVFDRHGNWLDPNRDGRNGLRRGAVDLDQYRATVQVTGPVFANESLRSSTSNTGSDAPPFDFDYGSVFDYGSMLAPAERKMRLGRTPTTPGFGSV
jgi:hypothetical protein